MTVGDGMSGFIDAANLLPAEIRPAVITLPENKKLRAEEFRLRIGQLPTILIDGAEREIPGTERVDRKDLQRVLELATGASPYASAEAVRRGYASAPGGVRVGFCGRVRPGSGGLWALEGITSTSIRIPREVRGCAEPYGTLPVVSTLIISPPGGGKTTLLRDLVRICSEKGFRVALCDERGELSSCSWDGFGFIIGKHTDVLVDLPKAQAAMQLIRTMNPQILAMDEISDVADAAACRTACGCGVSILATAHGNSLTDVLSRPVLGELLRSGAFSRFIVISVRGGSRFSREEGLP